MEVWHLLTITWLTGPLAGLESAIPYPTELSCGRAIAPIFETFPAETVMVQCIPTAIPSVESAE